MSSRLRRQPIQRERQGPTLPFVEAPASRRAHGRPFLFSLFFPAIITGKRLERRARLFRGSNVDRLVPDRHGRRGPPRILAPAAREAYLTGEEQPPCSSRPKRPPIPRRSNSCPDAWSWRKARSRRATPPTP